MYFILKISNMSFEKIKTGIFYDPQICQLSRDELFIKKNDKTQKENTCLAGKNLVKECLLNTRAENYT